MATAPRMVGESCRINMLTPDPVYDHEFCEGLLRWSYRDIPGMGYLILVDGKQAGGMLPHVVPNGPSSPPGIGVMVRVENADATAAKATALGGQTVTTTIEGRQRFTVNMRYPRELRDNPTAIAGDILVALPAGGTVPLGEVASVKMIVETDRKVNQLEKAIDDDCAHIIARRQPAATDLRLVMAITKTVTDLERIGDEAKTVSQQGL